MYLCLLVLSYLSVVWLCFKPSELAWNSDYHRYWYPWHIVLQELNVLRKRLQLINFSALYINMGKYGLVYYFKIDTFLK